MADVVISKDDDDIMEMSSIDMSDNEVEIKRKTNRRKSAKPVKPAKPTSRMFKPALKPRPTFRAPTQQPREDIDDNTFEMFSNPQKTIPRTFESQQQDDDAESMSAMSSIPEDMNDAAEDFEELKPSPGFGTLEEEKQDLLYKLHRLEEKGYKLTKKFNVNSDIVEMRAEIHKVKKDAELKGSLKFSRRMLMACVSGMEFLNKTYDPFKLELNGWSENVMENLNDGDYDNVFERLHEKYSGKVNAPPEIELMLGLTGSALMFHITSSMFKNMPSMGADPAAMRNMVKNMTKAQAQPGSAGGMPDISSMFNAFQPPQSSRAENPPIQEEDSFMSDDSAGPSDMNSSNPSVRNVAVSEGGALGGRRRGRKSKIIMSKDNTIDI